MNTNITAHEKTFARYAESFCTQVKDDAMLRLKIVHTKHVLLHMRTLVKEESVLFPHARACLLAALYHDIGRFEQFSQYGTFKDAHSINHATLGAHILQKEGFLNTEIHALQRQVITAVSMHNRYALPKKLALPLLHITQAVRDADKLDILRIMAEHFSHKGEQSSAVTFYAKDEPLMYSDKILQDVMQNRLASYADIVYINDFKLLLCSWIHDLVFVTSKKTLASRGYLESILADLPKLPPLQAVQEQICYMLRKL